MKNIILLQIKQKSMISLSVCNKKQESDDEAHEPYFQEIMTK